MDCGTCISATVTPARRSAWKSSREYAKPGREKNGRSNSGNDRRVFSSADIIIYNIAHLGRLLCYRADMSKPKLVIFASGTNDGGGSGFENLVRSPEVDAEIIGVVSNHERGGVRMRSERLGVPFIYFPGPFTESGYHGALDKT